jgi:hypothetical protein
LCGLSVTSMSSSLSPMAGSEARMGAPAGSNGDLPSSSKFAYLPLVAEILINVRTGIRTKAELKKCGCPSCREALRILEGKT